MPPLALMRRVPDAFVGCVTRRPARPPLDAESARRQQLGYRARLEEGGFAVTMLPGDEAHPDCAFVEDTAVVVGEAVLLTRPGHPSRRGEVGRVGEALTETGMAVTAMEGPATLDGGDVLRVGGRLFVGESERTNEAGRTALRKFAEGHGLQVAAVPISGVLHLKSCATALDDQTVLAFPDALRSAVFRGLRLVPVGGDDPEAANVVRLPDGRVLTAAHLPQTAAAVRGAGFAPVACEVSEFARADGGLTCLSIRLRDRLARGTT
jgi:dimethylargininase